MTKGSLSLIQVYMNTHHCSLFFFQIKCHRNCCVVKQPVIQRPYRWWWHFKKIKINCVDVVWGGGWVWADRGLEEGKRKEQRVERREGEVGGFVLGMRGRGLRGEGEIHQGEDFSTRAHPLIHADRSSGPVFVTARTLHHLWGKHASLQLLPDTSTPRHGHACLCVDSTMSKFWKGRVSSDIADFFST